MSFKRTLILLGLSLLCTACATNHDLANNKQMANETAAQKGVRYLLGRGVSQSDTMAFTYFKKAANENDPFAQSELAYMYAAGKGTPQDYKEALKWYQKAAEQGLAGAQYNLGLMYLHGLGTESNKTLAIQWFTKAAAHNFEPAKLALQQLQS